MDTYITISSINDFLFCPRSLYFHNIYSSFNTSIFNDTPQIRGTIAHENIDQIRYTTSKNFLQGLSVFNSRLGIKGKINLYDIKNKSLIERKNKVSTIYTGYKYQLYAQLYCIEESGFSVNHLFIQSLSDNKRYEIPIPTLKDTDDFELTIEQMKNFDSKSLLEHSCDNCQNNIYGLFNW